MCVYITSVFTYRYEESDENIRLSVDRIGETELTLIDRIICSTVL
jgi:hypothetical protein